MERPYSYLITETVVRKARMLKYWRIFCGPLKSDERVGGKTYNSDISKGYL